MKDSRVEDVVMPKLDSLHKQMVDVNRELGIQSPNTRFTAIHILQSRIKTLDDTLQNMTLRLGELERKVFPKCGECGRPLQRAGDDPTSGIVWDGKSVVGHAGPGRIDTVPYDKENSSVASSILR